jgi:predicted  nucleic acid-binding Zn-ribbon protein
MKAMVLKNDFSKQLQDTNTSILDLTNQIKALEVKREQLKGAVYALETLINLESESVTENAEKTEPTNFELKKKK